MNRAILIFTAAALLSISAFAQRAALQTNNSISGIARYTNGHPVADARIEARNLATGFIAGTAYTGPSGSFEISNLPDGPYEVVVNAGLEEASERIDVRGGMPGSLSLRLPLPDAQRDVGNNHSVSVAAMRVPGKARDEFHKAQESLNKRKIDDTKKHVQRALELYPDYAEALTLRAILRLDDKDSDGAQADLDLAIKADPNLPLAYFALGAIDNSLSKFDDAIRTIDRGIGLAPMSWQGYFEMGKAFLGKGDFKASVRQLNKAQLYAPKDFVLVHLVKAHALMGMESYGEAMAELQSYLDRAPQGPNTAQAQEMMSKARAFAAAGTK